MMRGNVLLLLLLDLGLAQSLAAQGRPPVLRPPEPPAAGMPVPSWLGRGKTITGHIAGVDPDRIMMRSYEFGDVLFFVDEKTIVRVDKVRLALSDLREGDPIAAHLKEIKNKGPYATEILPHPEVRRRKEKGEAPPVVATPLDVPSEPVSDAAPKPKAAVPKEEELPVPALPAGQKGVTGTVTEVRDDQATVRTPGGASQQVLVTAVTRIAKAGGRSGSDQILTEVRAGDKVAVMGDTLDNGLLVAHEILVNRSAAVASAVSQPGSPEPAVALSGDFTGVIANIDGDNFTVRTPEGKDRQVLVTPVTIVRRWGTDVTFSSVRKGDQVKVTGDVLEGGITLAREVTVTKSASSR